MTAIVSWNIQCGKGCDGATDLARIALVMRAMGEADVICLQEVARNDPGIAGGADQAAQLETLFPGYRPVFGPGLDRMQEGSVNRRQFGNMILSRLPVLQVFRHLLPRPPEPGIKHMQRAAVETVVQARGGALRVVSTHLEYFSARHRAAQIARLRQLQDEASGNAAAPSTPGETPYDPVPRPASLVLCGDFNLLPDDTEYELLFGDGLLDAWRVSRPDEPHPPSTGLYDRVQWPKGGHCRDYFAVTADVAARIGSIDMDSKTDASDHQPLRLVIGD
jgi:endonuclease/exonuclease/phosphatase family metal-dependent hydrolase